MNIVKLDVKLPDVKILNIKSKFPYGKYRNHTIIEALQSNNPQVLSYLKWWNRTIYEYRFSDEIKNAIEAKNEEIKYIQDKYAAEELYRNKSYDDCEITHIPSKGWDLPIDDKPLEYYLYCSNEREFVY